MKYSNSGHYSLVIHDGARDDLDGIWEVNEDAAADIEVFLAEAKQNQRTLDNLTINGYIQYGDSPYDVSEWGEAKKQRYILWRVKLLWLKGDAKKYRIVYAFHPTEFRYYVLGVVDRSFNYAINHPISKRITAAYNALDIPRY
jgi:hypothetical protein